MRKGISPIVAVVLLIAIAVIAAVGLYFWVGGLATKQPTTTAPIPISAQKVSCNLGGAGGTNLTALVQNLDASNALRHTLIITVDSGQLLQNNSLVNIAASSQGTVTFVNATNNASSTMTTGNTYVISSNTTISGVGVGTAQIVC
jgi:flagellin-like protein